VLGSLFQCKICAISGGEQLGSGSGIRNKAPIDFNEVGRRRLDDGMDSILADFAVPMSLGIVDCHTRRETEIIELLSVATGPAGQTYGRPWRASRFRRVIIMDVSLT
jgi:hypothetical protein